MTNLPSWPASGDVFTWKFMVSVGSSTFSGGSASGASASQSVSPMESSSMPVKSTMSPARASCIGTRSMPRKPSTWFTFSLRGTLSGPCITEISVAGRILPRLMRPTPMRPT